MFVVLRINGCLSRTATRAIDLADVVACGPASDSATRTDFVAALLAPLNQQKRRLPASLRQLAGLITDDVALDYDWAVAEADSAALPTSRHASSHRILLYSLDNGTLARVEKTINLEWPNVRVEISSDKDGNPALKQHARNADLIVVATRRATHAATGFITDNAGAARSGTPTARDPRRCSVQSRAESLSCWGDAVATDLSEGAQEMAGQQFHVIWSVLEAVPSTRFVATEVPRSARSTRSALRVPQSSARSRVSGVRAPWFRRSGRP